MSETKTMIVSLAPQLTLGRTAQKESVDIDIFGVTIIDAKIIFKKNLRNVSTAASHRLGIPKCQDQSLLVHEMLSWPCSASFGVTCSVF